VIDSLTDRDNTRGNENLHRARVRIRDRLRTQQARGSFAYIIVDCSNEASVLSAPRPGDWTPRALLAGGQTPRSTPVPVQSSCARRRPALELGHYDTFRVWLASIFSIARSMSRDKRERELSCVCNYQSVHEAAKVKLTVQTVQFSSVLYCSFVLSYR